jgi:hypothetical protein
MNKWRGQDSNLGLGSAAHRARFCQSKHHASNMRTVCCPYTTSPLDTNHADLLEYNSKRVTSVWERLAPMPALVTLGSCDLRVQLPLKLGTKPLPSHPTSIGTALKVEPVQSSAPIKHNLPFYFQAPALPRCAIEGAVTLARILRYLIRKVVEHPVY